jgi:ubiquinone/menaquinone biosynthesis C-methylase UbiE
MLERVLEPEVMDSEADAQEYDSMDHAAVNAVFVTDLAAVLSPDAAIEILDLGAGTAQIPIELCRRFPNMRVVAVDAAESMLALARQNVAAAGLSDRIELVLADAKRLPFADGTFSAVISNSIVHHIAVPAGVLAESVRVAKSNALQFHRDLARPMDEATLEHLVATYAGSSTAYQRRLFGESLRAALTLTEIRSFVAQVGGQPGDVQMTSDRHWTWSAT